MTQNKSMKTKLLVNAENFMLQLEKDILAAMDSVLVQAMTFEGDNAGRRLIKALMGSHAKRKVLVVDSYTRAVINDHFVVGFEYLRSSAFRSEVKETRKLFNDASNAGIEIKFTNPLGVFMYKYPLRNHKKMVVVDSRISYIGGINFSDHNFEWHDAMIRIEEEDIGGLLYQDIQQTLDGVNQSNKHEIGDDSFLYFLNGIKSKEIYKDLFDHISSARRSIDIISPYVSDPLLSLIQGFNSNLSIRLISPGKNNKSIFKKYLDQEAKKGCFKLYHYQPGMSHLKAILVDDSTLIMGSSNFDVISYYFEQEVVFVSKHKPLIQEFRTKVLNVDLEESKRVDVADIEPSNVSGLLKGLKLFSQLASSSFLKPK